MLTRRRLLAGSIAAVAARAAQAQPSKTVRLGVLVCSVLPRPTKPDLIIAAGGDVAPFAKRATTTIPIVMITSADPVQGGLVASLARPGGNVTGVTFVSSELAGKRLQFLKEAAPAVTRVAVLWNPEDPDDEFRATQAAARSLGVQVARILDLASQNRVLVASGWGPWAAEGGLLSYGPDLDAIIRSSATYVDRILKGARPADIPVEQPTKFALVINLKTAKRFGLTIPPGLLQRADQVIE